MNDGIDDEDETSAGSQSWWLNLLPKKPDLRLPTLSPKLPTTATTTTVASAHQPSSSIGPSREATDEMITRKNGDDEKHLEQEQEDQQEHPTPPVLPEECSHTADSLLVSVEDKKKNSGTLIRGYQPKHLQELIVEELECCEEGRQDHQPQAEVDKDVSDWNVSERNNLPVDEDETLPPLRLASSTSSMLSSLRDSALERRRRQKRWSNCNVKYFIHKRQENDAATKIQSWWRLWSTNANVARTNKWSEAARKIQSMARVVLAQEKVERMRSHDRNQREHEAAIKIQRLVRRSSRASSGRPKAKSWKRGNKPHSTTLKEKDPNFRSVNLDVLRNMALRKMATVQKQATTSKGVQLPQNEKGVTPPLVSPHKTVRDSEGGSQKNLRVITAPAVPTPQRKTTTTTTATVTSGIATKLQALQRKRETIAAVRIQTIVRAYLSIRTGTGFLVHQQRTEKKQQQPIMLSTYVRRINGIQSMH